MDLEAALDVLYTAFTRYVTPTREEWEDIRSRWYVRRFRRYQHLIREGEVEQHFYFILEGVHRLYFVDRQGREVSVGFAYAPSYSGVADSLIYQTPSHYGLQALTPGTMLALHHDDLNDLFDRYRVMDRWGRLLWQDILVGRGKREREMMSMTAEERYQRLLRESPQVLQLIPQKHLASYLGMTPETFSRLRQRVR